MGIRKIYLIITKKNKINKLSINFNDDYYNILICYMF